MLDQLTKETKIRLTSFWWRWLLPIAGAIPLIGLYIAWDKWGGWVWATLLILALVALLAVGVWDLSRPWDDD